MRGFEGKVAALTGLLSALVAFAPACSGPENSSPPSDPPVPEQHSVPRSQAGAPPASDPATGRHCCNAAGVKRCEIKPLPVGSPCYCLWQGSDSTWRVCE